MRILLVSGFFYPQNTPRAFRTTELAKVFSRLGHSVKIFIPWNDSDYSDFINKYPNVEISYIENTNNTIPKNKIKYAIWRIANIAFSYPSILYYQILPKTLEDEKDYDLLISIAVPHPIHWGVGRIYKKRRIAKTWIADCGDPFMFCKTDSYPTPFYMSYFEKLWCRKCDFISVPTETSYTGYYPEFWNKIRVIPQGFNFDGINLPEYKKNNIPTFAFAGCFIPGKRDPQRLFDFLASLDKSFKFIIYGTSDYSRWNNALSTLGDKVIFEKPIPREELLAKLAQMDFLINIGNGTNVQTPSKLIDYTLVNRPFLTVETNDIKEKTITEFLNGDYTNADTKIDISKYDIHNVAKQFLDLCK